MIKPDDLTMKLSIRGYFAAHAMNGACAATNGLVGPKAVAEWSVRMADEMIKALNEMPATSTYQPSQITDRWGDPK